MTDSRVKAVEVARLFLAGGAVNYEDLDAMARALLALSGGEKEGEDSVPSDERETRGFTREYLEEASILQMAAAISVETVDGCYLTEKARLSYFRGLARAAFRVIPDFALNLCAPPSSSPAVRDALYAVDRYLSERMGPPAFATHGRNIRKIIHAALNITTQDPQEMEDPKSYIGSSALTPPAPGKGE